MATITKRGKSYRIRAYAGYDVDGQQIEHSKTWTPPQGMTEKVAAREANRQAILFEEAIKNGLELNRKIKFHDFGEKWFASYAEKQLRPRTVAGYRDLWMRITPSLGHIMLDKITPTHLLDFYDTLTATTSHSAVRPTKDVRELIRTAGMTKAAFSNKVGVSLSTLGTVFRGGQISYKVASKIAMGLDERVEDLFETTSEDKTLSSSSVKKYHQLINKMLQDAVAWQYIPYNPCARVASPKAAATRISYLDEKQAIKMLKLLHKEDGMYRRPIYLLFLTGMRRGELLGLEWSDIDWQGKKIEIRRTSQYLAKKGVFTDETKNFFSARSISISDATVDVLLEQKTWQLHQEKQLGSRWIYNNRVITMENGRLMRPDRLTHWFTDFVRRTDSPPIHLHSLRHTYATLSLSQGAPLNGISAQLGHATVATTAKIYAHSVPSVQMSTADKIGAFFEVANQTAK